MIKKIRNSLGPLLLIICCTPFVILMWYTNTVLDGSFSALFQLFLNQGFFSTIYSIWQPVFFGSATAWQIIFGFIFLEFVLIKYLPGRTFLGPVTPNGNTPVYKANGVLAFMISLGAFCFSTFYFHFFPASIIYDHFGEILGALNFFSLLLCVGLYLKGRYKPSTTDSGVTGNIIFDYYWGTELYPTLWAVNLKMFINCRLGMMSWGLILLSYAAKQNEVYGLSNSMIIAVSLQLLYIAKFYIWETGYLASLDIMHDRAGYYICWGCLVWVPGIYTSPTMYLVNHPNQLDTGLAWGIFLSGVICIAINYLADRQRQLVRATSGDCRIWGAKPKIIVARYTTESGASKKNSLLYSGWWGIARHFHYLPEIAAAFFWSLPAFFSSFAPWFYVCFLTVLLLDRANRDDARCAIKYGIYWQDYCSKVPYKILPCIY